MSTATRVPETWELTGDDRMLRELRNGATARPFRVK